MTGAPPVVHWDGVEPRVADVGHLGGAWQDLGSAAGSVTVGIQRMRIPPGKWSTPVHAELAEEEIHYVLGGSGLSWQEGVSYEISAGDCLVHLVEEETHTLRAGPSGLEVLAFGTRAGSGGTHLPRAGVVRLGPASVPDRADRHPWELEAEAGEPVLTPPAERPARIVATSAVREEPFGNGGEVASVRRDLGDAAGSRLTGLGHVTVAPGKLSVPLHCHSVEEELFVVLDGAGVLLLGDEEHPVRRGSVVARPAATRVSHTFRAGSHGLVYLAYGTRDPSDVAYYPRSRKISFRGVGVIARLEPLDYWDGEP